jgi:hypothetical protein
LKPRQRISPCANRKLRWRIGHHQVSQSPQATKNLVAFNHYSSYRYTLSSNKQATDLIRYSNFRSKSPTIIPILLGGYFFFMIASGVYDKMNVFVQTYLWQLEASQI